MKLSFFGKWHPVIRYDTAHGFAHRDTMHPDGSVDKVSLLYWDYNEALTFAQYDIKSNWEWYRQRYKKGNGKMNKKELFERNLILSTEFSRYVMENPEVANRIPKDALVVILPEYDQELAEENLKIAETKREKDQPMVLVRVKRLAPERKSRLIKPTIEIVSA